MVDALDMFKCCLTPDKFNLSTSHFIRVITKDPILKKNINNMCTCVYVCACGCVRVRASACVRACVHACVRAAVNNNNSTSYSSRLAISCNNSIKGKLSITLYIKRE